MDIRLSQFTGPYDLLLSLVGEKKLNISELALSEVTEQFLRYVDGLPNHKAEELADFLVVATRLVLLKARMLLPQFAVEDDDGDGSLEDQLRLYKQFVDASKKINKLWLSPELGFFRFESPRRPAGFLPGAFVTSDRLHDAMLQLVRRLTPPKPIPETSIDRAISLKERIDRIRDLLKKTGKINFYELVSESGNKTEVIVSFLALLELVKQKTLTLYQDDAFGDIVIERV